MATLEDRILGEKLEYYCSSSEDEDERHPVVVQDDSVPPPPKIQSSAGGPARNTGPKGVMEDYRQYKQLETEQAKDKEMERLQLAKRLCLTNAPQTSQASDSDDEEDDFMSAYRLKRIEEMKRSVLAKQNARFNQVNTLANADEYLDAIENNSKTATVIIHIHEPHIPACNALNETLQELAGQLPGISFCKIRSAVLPTTKTFRSAALPTLQAYKNGQLIGNWVRVGDELGQEFGVNEVEGFLREFGVLPDYCV